MAENGWRRNLSSFIYHKIAVEGWLGWDKIDDELCCVNLSIVKGKDKSSRDYALEWDDMSQGNFWYRDVTNSGLPFVDDGEEYKSVFVFQFKEDYEKFKSHFGIKEGKDG